MLEPLEARQMLASHAIAPLVPPAPWDSFVPLAINNNGQIAGVLLDDGHASHAAVRSGGKFIDLGTFGGTSSQATAINASGQVVGFSTFADGSQRAWKSGASGALPLVGLGQSSAGGNVSQALAVNDAGLAA